MGVDIPNICTVIHFGATSIDRNMYIQGVGMVVRDGYNYSSYQKLKATDYAKNNLVIQVACGDCENCLPEMCGNLFDL